MALLNKLPIDKLMYWAMLLLAGAAQISTSLTRRAIYVGMILLFLDCIRRKVFPCFDRKMAIIVGSFVVGQLVIAGCSYKPIYSFKYISSYFAAMLPFVFVSLYIKNKEQINGLLLVFMCSVAGNALYAGREFWNNLQAGKPLTRLCGIDGGPTEFAPQMLLAIAVMLAIITRKEFSRWIRLLAVVLCGLCFFDIIFSLTRGIWLSFAAILLIVTAAYYKSWWPKIIVVLVIISILGVKGQYPNIAKRFNIAREQRPLIWASAVAMAKDFPLTGVGQTNFPEIYHRRYIDDKATDRVYRFVTPIPQKARPPKPKPAPKPAPKKPASKPAPQKPAPKPAPQKPTQKPAPKKPAPVRNHRLKLVKLADIRNAPIPHAHNDIINTAAEGGLVGLMAFFALHGYLAFLFWRGRKREPHSYGMKYAAVGLLVCLVNLCAGMTDTPTRWLSWVREYYFLTALFLVASSLETNGCSNESEFLAGIKWKNETSLNEG